MKKESESPSSGGVQVLERALSLLELLARADGWMGISELSLATGQPVGTVHRLLMTLLARGYVLRDERTRRYTLGPSCRLLAGRVLHAPDWKTLATPFLQQLVELSGETTNLAILEGSHAIYVAQAQSARLVRMFTEPGNRVPLHATACGKVLLAFHPPALAGALLDQAGLPAFTSTTITDLPRFQHELAVVRLRGYAIDNGEQEEGVRCVSVPVFGFGGSIQAAISVSGPSNRLAESHVPALVPQLQRISAAISAALLEIPPPTRL